MRLNKANILDYMEGYGNIYRIVYKGNVYPEQEAQITGKIEKEVFILRDKERLLKKTKSLE
ncbi:MAG: hypothetical protein APF77_22745 [Clostridia bacterium BRH_c25]|nr:MAG: hypothetical protein APF77_22745 [Clostridia bacterium BRH_c25]